MPLKLDRIAFFLIFLSLFLGCGKKKKDNGGENLEKRGANSPSLNRDLKEEKRLSGNVSRGEPFPWEKDKKKGGKKEKGGPQLIFQENYQKAIALSSEKKYTEAISILQEILTQYPRTPEGGMAQYRLAEIYFDSKDNERATKEFEKLLKEFPESPAAENARAALNYLKTIKTHQEQYISPELEKVGRW